MLATNEIRVKGLQRQRGIHSGSFGEVVSTHLKTTNSQMEVFCFNKVFDTGCAFFCHMV